MRTASELSADNRRHAEWIALLEVAAREVFELMLGCQLTVPQTLTDEPTGITSMVGLAGQLCGVMSIRCSKVSATIMASKMLGIQIDEVGPNLADSLGEIGNMVAGNFKNKIEGLSDGCMLSVPTVIMGNDYSLYSLTGSDTLSLKLPFENLPIVISLAIHS